VEVAVGVTVGLGGLVRVVVGVSVCVAVAVGVDVCSGVNVALGAGVGSRRAMELGEPQAAMNTPRPARRRKALRDRRRCSEDGAIASETPQVRAAGDGYHLFTVAGVFVQVVGSIDSLDLEPSMTEE
jgi:hypothetical protein